MPALGAPIERLLARGGVMFVAAGPAGLHAVDISDPGSPARTAVLSLPGPALDLDFVDASHLYVAMGAAGLAVVGAETPARPRFVAQVTALGAVAAVAGATSGSGAARVWAAGNAGSLKLVDASRPLGPRVVAAAASEWSAGRSVRVATSGRRAIVLNDQLGIEVFEVQGDDAVRRVGGLDLTAAGPGPYADIAVPDDRQLYVAGAGSGLIAVDTADAAWPRAGAAAPVAGGARAVAVAGGAAYAGGEATQLAVFELSAPGTPAARGGYAPPRDVVAVAARRGYAYALTEGPVGLAVAFVEASGNPLPAGFLPLAAEPADVRLAALRSGYFAYLLYYNAFEAVDMTAPLKPEKRRTLAAPDAKVMAIHGTHAFLGGDGLRVIDLGVPDDPRQIAYQFRAGAGEAIAADGDRVYIAQRSVVGARPTDLWVFDVADRAHPRQIGALGDIKTTVGLAAWGGFAYQVYDFDRRYGIQVYDARDPAAVRAVPGAGNYATDGYARHIVRDGRRLYLVEEAYFDRVARRWRGRNGVHVLDLAQPERPRLAQFIAFAEPIGAVDASEGRLLVAARQKGLFVVDVATGVAAAERR